MSVEKGVQSLKFQLAARPYSQQDRPYAVGLLLAAGSGPSEASGLYFRPIYCFPFDVLIHVLHLFLR